MGYMYPLAKGVYRRTQNFGARPGGVNPSGGHTGQDDAVPVGTPVYAPADGKIVWADWCRTANGSDNPWLLTQGGGIVVGLDCGDDKPTFFFAHLNATSLNTGDRVKAGDIIGYTGNTGTWTTGPHLHTEAMLPGYYLYSNTYGRSNPDPLFDHFKDDFKVQPQSAPRPANVRTAGNAVVNQRAEPKLHAPVVRQIPAKSREVWEGWVHGETVDLGGGNVSDIWLKDAKGYASILFFDPTNVDGLPDLTPRVEALGPKERKAGAAAVNQRKEPRADAPVVRTIPALSREIWEGYVKGDMVTGADGTKSDLWYKDSIGYASVLFFDPVSTAGLPDLTPQAPAPAPAPAPTPGPAPAPAPAPAPDPVPAPYTFAPASPLVTELRPAAEGHFLRGNMPDPVTGLVVHQFIADETRFDVHLDSVIQSFTKGERVASAHFGVEGKRVVQFVDLKDRAYHAGVKGNDFWSIEVYGGMDEETLATVAALIRELNRIAGRELTLYRHKELMATACGTHVDLDKIRGLVAATPAPVPAPAPAPDVKEAIMRFVEHLVDDYLAGK